MLLNGKTWQNAKQQQTKCQGVVRDSPIHEKFLKLSLSIYRGWLFSFQRQCQQSDEHLFDLLLRPYKTLQMLHWRSRIRKCGSTESLSNISTKRRLPQYWIMSLNQNFLNWTMRSIRLCRPVAQNIVYTSIIRRMDIGQSVCSFSVEKWTVCVA